MQSSLFSLIYPEYRIKNKVRLIELFGGIGCQAKAMENLGVDFEHYRLVEFDPKAVLSYNAIHGTNYTPSDVTQIAASDLGITDTDKFTYLLTYSFPCQDLSNAGKKAGMEKGSGTRSGLLWEVERILLEIKQKEMELPQILLMENVPAVHGKGNKKNFNDWIKVLESLGYSNYWKDLSAKDYGIPQNRNRCFMVSILGNYSYTFPPKQKLKLKFLDLLEEDVDEKYTLSKKMINCFMSDGTGKYPRRERFLQNINRKNQDVGNSVTTLAGNRATDNFIVMGYGNNGLNETIEKNEIENGDILDTYNKTVHKDIANTITTGVSSRNTTFIAVKNKKEELCDKMIEEGYVKEGDVVNHSYSTSRMKKPDIANNENPDCFSALTTRPDTLGVCVVGNYMPSGHHASRVVDPEGLAPTVTENHGTVTSIAIKNATKQGYLEAEEGDGVDISGRMEYHRETVQKGLAQTITTAGGENQGVVTRKGDDLIIRKATPRECMRLMGFDDESITRQLSVVSDAKAYYQAGNGIVVQVLEAIIKQFYKEGE